MERTIFGFGTRQTTKNYRKTCDDFVIIEKPKASLAFPHAARAQAADRCRA